MQRYTKKDPFSGSARRIVMLLVLVLGSNSGAQSATDSTTTPAATTTPPPNHAVVQAPFHPLFRRTGILQADPAAAWEEETIKNYGDLPVVAPSPEVAAPPPQPPAVDELELLLAGTGSFVDRKTSATTRSRFHCQIVAFTFVLVTVIVI